MGKKRNALKPLKLQEQRIVTAYHEAGHVVANWFLEYTDPLLMISTISRDTEMRWTVGGDIMRSCGEKPFYTKAELFDRMSFYLGGAVAERIFFRKVRRGFEKDLSYFVRVAFQVFNMNKEILQLLIDSSQSYNEATARIIQNQVIELFRKSYCRTLKLLTKHKKDVEKVAFRLLDKEMIARDEVRELLGPRPFKAKSILEEYLDGIICSTLFSTFIGLLSWIEIFKQKLQKYLPNALPEIDVSRLYRGHVLYAEELPYYLTGPIEFIAYGIEEVLGGISMIRKKASSIFLQFLETLRKYCNRFLSYMVRHHQKSVLVQPLISIEVLLYCMSKTLVSNVLNDAIYEDETE